MFSKNAERSDVTWGQLAFDTETLGSLQRSNPKVSLLIQIVALLPMMTIIVAFLTRLGCFQLITNNANSEHVFNNLVNSFDLTARLRMKSRTKGEMSSNSILKASTESRGKKATTIRIDFQRNTVKGYNSRDV